MYKLENETKVEYWDKVTVNYYVYENGSLIPDYSNNLENSKRILVQGHGVRFHLFHSKITI